MAWFDFLLNPKTQQLISLGRDAAVIMEGICQRDADEVSSGFLTMIHDGGQLVKIKELTAERLEKYHQGMTLVTAALFEDVK